MSSKPNFVAYWFLLCGFMVTSSTISDRRYCGYQHTDDYVRSDYNISIDEFPWMAQLVYNKELNIWCSGSLISSRHVLTAAHCISRPGIHLTMIRLGDHNVKTATDCVTRHGETECSDPVQQFQIKNIIVHPAYNLITGEHNIALIELFRIITFSEYIRPICLPNPHSLPLKAGEQLLSSGWGALGVNLEQTDFKKRVVASLITNKECKNINKIQTTLITPNHLCVIEESKSITCLGDSGGPLMYSIKNQWEQVGILSFSGGCGKEWPSVHVKVSNYLNWIEEIVRPKKVDNSLENDTIIFPSD